jgi:hypothetical protein
VAPERLPSLAVQRSDKALILPAALRAPKGITKNQRNAYLCRRTESPVSRADLSVARVASSGMDEPFVTHFEGAR